MGDRGHGLPFVLGVAGEMLADISILENIAIIEKLRFSFACHQRRGGQPAPLSSCRSGDRINGFTSSPICVPKLESSASRPDRDSG